MGGQPLRRAADVSPMTKDAWIDSVELEAVRPCCLVGLLNMAHVKGRGVAWGRVTPTSCCCTSQCWPSLSLIMVQGQEEASGGWQLGSCRCRTGV